MSTNLATEIGSSWHAPQLPTELRRDIMGSSQEMPARAPEILDLLALHAARRPNDIAIRHLKAGRPAQDATWAELLQASQSASETLRRAIPAADFVPAYIGKSIAGIATMVGAIACGKVYAGVSPKFRAPQLEHVLTGCTASAALVDSSGLAAVRDGLSASARLRATNWWWLDPPATSPITRAAAAAIKADSTLEELATAALTPGAEVTPRARPLDPDRPAVCLFTSGSTGAPKGVLIAWTDLYERALAECALFGLSEHDCLLSLLPFSFDVGLNQLLAALQSGARLVILDSWLPADILNAIAGNAVTGVSGVPSIWLSILKANRVFEHPGAHATLRYLTVSGGDMEVEQLRRLSAAAPGVGIFKTYGQTESFRSTALRPIDFAARPASVGKPFGTARVYIVRPDGTRAGIGEQGEVVHTGLGVMLGYLNGNGIDGKRRHNPFIGPDDPSPFAIFTGDQGHVDAQGFLHLAGRQDDMVKVAGNRIHLAELAAEMARIPGVLAAEAVSVPVAGADPHLAVFVVADHAATALTTDTLKAEAARRLPTYMLPRLIELRSSFPLTASGKPDRQALRAEAAQLLHAP